MGQYDVLDWLRKQRDLNDDFFTLKEIYKGLNCVYCERTLRQNLANLTRGDLIEVELGGDLMTWQRHFRAKK